VGACERCNECSDGNAKGRKSHEFDLRMTN
jgi:hypothetical protein